MKNLVTRGNPPTKKVIAKPLITSIQAINKIRQDLQQINAKKYNVLEILVMPVQNIL